MSGNIAKRVTEKSSLQILDGLPGPSASLQERAAFVMQAQKALDAAFRNREMHRHDQAAWATWERAVQVCRLAVDAAYPPGFWEAYTRLREGDHTALELPTAFLEADPWFFRSGYIKAELIQRIKRLDIPPEYAERLRVVVLNAVDGRDRREFRSYCRLARKLDSPILRTALEARLASNEPDVRRRAGWMLQACEQEARLHIENV